jgi:hypothetical protein
MTDYIVAPGVHNDREVTLWEVEDRRLGVGPASLPLLTVGVDRARDIGTRLLQVADEVAVVR